MRKISGLFAWGSPDIEVRNKNLAGATPGATKPKKMRTQENAGYLWEKGGMFTNHHEAQAAFDTWLTWYDSSVSPEEAEAWETFCKDYHDNSREEDSLMVDSINGEREKVLAWYWETAYQAGHDWRPNQ